MTAPRRAPTRTDIPVLLRARPREIWVELTSDCNARCIYCCVSQPGYRGKDLAMSPEQLADMLAPYAPPEVRITGHGETTMLPHWTKTAKLLLERGFAVTTNSNFAKEFSDDEIDVLSRFRSLEISCDIADAELLPRVRRGCRLERIEANLARIVATCEREFRELPHLNISATLTDLTMHGLPDLVRWAHARRCHALEVVNLERYPAPPGGLAWRHPSEADPERMLALIEEARGVARELGFTFRVQQGLIDACLGVLGQKSERPFNECGECRPNPTSGDARAADVSEERR
ncbi:MAG: radical SAM protein [Planctomycetes bacterium]|nr:radical SAM protein [Planctomycetota bacterium]